MTERRIWKSIQELMDYSKKTVGQPIKALVDDTTVDYYYTHKNNKGWVGNSMESDYFGLPNNNRAEADFPEIHTELKITPMKQTKRGWSAKERLSLNIMDFKEEYKNTFETSSFIKKARYIDLIFYEYVKDIPSPELFIRAAELFDFYQLPEEDLLIMKQDYETIINKIKEGKAEELSDSLTRYLGATTKGGKSESNLRPQPFSDKEAHQRAFTLKTSYMTQIVRRIMDGTYQVTIPNEEKVIKNIECLKDHSFDEIILSYFENYIGKTVPELIQELHIQSGAKQIKSLIIQHILRVTTDVENTEEFKKSGICVKTITIKKNRKGYTPTEAFKLLSADFSEIYDHKWEDSTLREFLSDTRFMLCIFEEKEDKTEIFKGVKFWRMPLSDLDSIVENTWNKTKRVISNGVILEIVKNKAGYTVKNNLPSIKDDAIIHLRPWAQKASYVNDSNAQRLPVSARWINRSEDLKMQFSDNYMTKQAYWLNPNYIYEQVREFFE